MMEIRDGQPSYASLEALCLDCLLLGPFTPFPQQILLACPSLVPCCPCSMRIVERLPAQRIIQGSVAYRAPVSETDTR